MKRTFELRWVLVLLAFGFAAACQSGGVRDEIITAENQTQVLEQVKKGLSYEEVELIKGYVARVEPELEEGQLPLGRTVGEMIDSQRAFLDSRVGVADVSEPATRSSSEVPQAAQSEVATPPPTVEVKPRAAAPVAERKPEPQPAPEPAPPVTVTVPSGTALRVRLMESLSSKTATEGDVFETELDQDLVVSGQLLAPAGSVVTGKVAEAEASGKVKGKAQMALRLEEIKAGEQAYSIRSNTLRFEAEGTGKRDAKRIGIASGAGAVIGAIAGGGKGAAIGAVIGAGAGTGVTVATPGDEVEFKTEQLFEFTLEREVEMKIR